MVTGPQIDQYTCGFKTWDNKSVSSGRRAIFIVMLYDKGSCNIYNICFASVNESGPALSLCVSEKTASEGVHLF